MNMNVIFSRPLRGSPSHGLFDPSAAGTVQGTSCRNAHVRSADNRMTLLKVNAYWQEIAVGVPRFSRSSQIGCGYR